MVGEPFVIAGTYMLKHPKIDSNLPRFTRRTRLRTNTGMQKRSVMMAMSFSRLMILLDALIQERREHEDPACLPQDRSKKC